MTIQNQKLVKPLSPIIIEKGKEVRLRIQSDQEEDFHLEGYHAFSPLKTDRVMILEFEALTVGSFPFYLDRSHTYLGSFEIVE